MEGTERIMNATEFTNLYTKQSYDEVLTPFEKETGFSLIRLYPEGTPYNKDGRRMFLKVAVLKRGFFYGVDMTKPDESGGPTEYVLTEGDEYRPRITNFVSDGGEFDFREVDRRIVHKGTGESFSLNEFVNILETNHLADRLMWKRFLNFIADILLKVSFWLSDKHYEKIRVSLDRYHFSKDNKLDPGDEETIEPFFKYFYISKNFIFSLLLIIFITIFVGALSPDKVSSVNMWQTFFGDFTLSNPIVVLLFFLGLFSAEKLSEGLNKQIKDFLMPENKPFSEPKQNFLEKLHNFQYQNKFDLRTDLPDQRKSI